MSATQPSPSTEPDASVIVTFKCETFIGTGETVGPVTVIDVAAMEADPHGAVNSPGRPNGYRPAWRTELGWLPRGAAEAVAAEHGVELTEA